MCTTVAHFSPRSARSSAGRPQTRHLFEEDIEGRFVELDDVHAIGLQGAGLLVQQARESHRHRGLVAVVAVGHGVDDGHRAGQRDLQLAGGVGAGQAGLGLMHPALQPQQRPTTCGTMAS
jgi:hypothetical protein